MSLIKTPSPEQQAVFDAISSSTDSLLVNAAAGSGKTSTIVHGTTLFPKYGQLIKFLAFNKSIKEELERRLPPTITASTFHSEGYRAWNKACGSRRLRVDADKCKNILKGFLNGREDAGLYFAYVLRLVSYAKGSGLGTHLAELTPKNLRQIAAHQGLWPEEEANEDEAIDLVLRVIARSNEQGSTCVDFDDMLYLPLLYKTSFERHNILVIDEAQDTNGVQRTLLKQMMTTVGGRLIAVGDPNQAIYGFRGADATAMDQLKDSFNMKELPLSVSWRCSQAVVKEAQQYCLT